MRIVALAALLLAAMPATAIAVVPADPWHASAADPVAMRTSAGHMPVKALVDDLVARFRAAGVPASAIAIVPVDQTQALVVRLAGRDRARKAILLSSHLDVVDANPKDWTRSPFTMIEENGYTYGRGTDDTKHCPSVPIAYAQLAGASNGREFRLAGIPDYGTSGLFQRDEDEFAHGLNERVRVDAVYHSVEYMLTLITELAPLG